MFQIVRSFASLAKALPGDNTAFKLVTKKSTKRRPPSANNRIKAVASATNRQVDISVSRLDSNTQVELAE